MQCFGSHFGLAAGLLLVLALATAGARADDDKPPEDVNYDEAKVPPYSLPDPLVLANGRPVRDAQAWFEYRRPELLKLFESEVYGRSPAAPEKIDFELVDRDTKALAGLATKKRVKITVHHDGKSHAFELVSFLPNQAPRPAPVFVGMRLFDKNAEMPRPGVPLRPTAAETEGSPPGATSNAQNQNEGASSLPPLPGADLAKAILGRGYAIATIVADELAPDSPERYRDGVIGLYAGEREADRQADAWGAIGAWAWGLSRAMDYFETDRDFDTKRVAVIGHSRMGKTALWAGALDSRFSLIISNNSGCAGAALSRRKYGETVKIINDHFPHWFCLNFRKYNDREDELPIDQHELIALAAPRLVYVASALEDRWADPRGEFLSCVHADPVYQLIDVAGLGVAELPPLGHAVGKAIGYHIRQGKHALTDFDWLKYLDFADTHWRFKVRPPSGDL